MEWAGENSILLRSRDARQCAQSYDDYHVSDSILRPNIKSLIAHAGRFPIAVPLIPFPLTVLSIIEIPMSDVSVVTHLVVLTDVA